jgi:hypothetical protein
VTRIDSGERLLCFLLLDGPIPASTGRQAWIANGMPANDERLLTASLRRVIGRPIHVGAIGGRWWWRTKGDQRPIPKNTQYRECNRCLRIYDLPNTTSLCLQAGCLGTYHPTEATPTPETHPYTVRLTERASKDTWVSEGWRGSPFRRGHSR